MKIEELKKELGISDKEISEFYGLKNVQTYRCSSAKPRYEAALCNFYAAVKSKSQELAKQKINK